jgi:transposase
MKDYEQIISTLLTKIAELEQVVKQQAAKIADLERRLNKNSSNSSKPPSSDGLGKPPRTTSLRENGKNKSGGQAGHKGETLKQTATPDTVKKHVLTTCPDCQHTLLQSPPLRIVKRQVFDIPPPKIEVTEHQAEVKYCTCCNKMVTALFPPGVLAPVQYGEVVRSWSIYYQYQQFIVSPRRKSLIDGLSGTVVHDHWKSYYNLFGVEHGLCNQHHLRELKAVIEHDKESWASEMMRLLRVTLRCRHFHTNKAIPAERIKWLIKIYDKIIKQGLVFHTAQTPLPCKGKQGRQPKRTGHNLLLRLFHYKQDVLRFLQDPAVPFTNNDAERDLRMMKCKQKVSGGFRTTQGAEQFARIRGFISTVRKQGFNVLGSIQAIFSDNIPIPAGS